MSGMDFLAQEVPSTQEWLIYGMMAMGLAYILYRSTLRKRKDPLEKPLSIGLSQQRAVEREMGTLLVEMSQMARQITAQLDTRSARLQALLEEADRKIEQLKQLSREAGTADARSPVEQTQTVRETPRPLRMEDPRHAEIYALADTGRSVPEIAEQLSRPRGEVELILALRGR